MPVDWGNVDGRRIIVIDGAVYALPLCGEEANQLSVKDRGRYQLGFVDFIGEEWQAVSPDGMATHGAGSLEGAIQSLLDHAVYAQP